MSKIHTIYNTTPLRVTLESRDGELTPFTIGEGNAHVDRNGIVVNFSTPSKSGGYENYVLMDKPSTKDKMLNVFADYVAPYGLVFVANTLVQKGVNSAIKDPNKAANVNLAMTITSIGTGVRKSLRNLISNQIKSLIKQWYDGEVAYFDISKGIELNIKPIKVDLPYSALVLFDE